MNALLGSWIWYELMTPDPKGAKAFYEAVVGWDVTEPSLRTAGYGFVGNHAGGMTGGILGLTAGMIAEGAKPAWLGYIGVPDCDAASASATAAGGKVLLPAMDVPEAGRIAMLADCNGTPYYVMTPAMSGPAQGPSTAFSRTLPGRCAWNELRSANRVAAVDYYARLYGWALPEPMDMGALGPYQFVAKDDAVLGAIMASPSGEELGWSFYFRVASIDAAVAAIPAAGGTLRQGPSPVPGGDHVITGIDPQGAAFALCGQL